MNTQPLPLELHGYDSRFAAQSGPCLQCYLSAIITPILLTVGTIIGLRWLYRRLTQIGG